MNIIIIGAGKVGFTLASYLAEKEDNDVTIIDTNEELLSKVSDKLDVSCIHGNGLGMLTLEEADANAADLVVATTSSDEINMLCCMTAKRLGAANVVARIRDPEYSGELEILKKQLGLDMVINPEQETAKEIARVLYFPTAISVEPLIRGKVELVAFRIKESDRIAGMSIKVIMTGVRQKMLFCAVLRGDDVTIPGGDFVLQAGDIAYITGEPSQIAQFFNQMGRNTRRVHNAMIIGGGRIAYYLCNMISKSGIRVKIIERDRELCARLDEMLPDCMIIHGDGTDESLLVSEDIEDMEAVICLTGKDEENLLVGLYAAKLVKPKVIVKVSRNNYEGIVKDFGIDTIITPKNITAVQIIRYVRVLLNAMGSNVEKLYYIVGGRAEVSQFTVKESTAHKNETFHDIQFKSNVLVASIVRDGKLIIPTGSDCFKRGDKVIIVSTQRQFSELNDVFKDGGKD